MGGRHGIPGAEGVKGRHKGHHYDAEDGTVHLDLRPELAKELHQLLTAALGGGRRKKHHPSAAEGHKGGSGR